MPLPPLVSLAQPQIRALVSRVPMPNENLAGRTITGYRLLERVGEGGTAEVYRAQHPEHGTCAFKVLRSRLASDPTAVKRFLPEAGDRSRGAHPRGAPAHAHRILRRNTQVRGPRSSVRGAGGRSGRHLQPRHHRVLDAHRAASPRRSHAARTISAAPHERPDAAERGGSGAALPPGTRGGGDAGPRARPRPSTADRDGIRRQCHGGARRRAVPPAGVVRGAQARSSPERLTVVVATATTIIWQRRPSQP